MNPGLETQSPIHAALKRAEKELHKPDCAHENILMTEIEFPEVRWGRDFEVRQALNRGRRETYEAFVDAFPKRFQPAREFWVNYVWQINDAFCEAFGIFESIARFGQTSKNQCTLFHSDFVLVRLFQTLKGLGTEYLHEENVIRSGLGSGCNSKIIRDQSGIQRAQEKEILLMRGEKWVRGQGLVHRSPPIEDQGLKRLYFCLDPVTEVGS